MHCQLLCVSGRVIKARQKPINPGRKLRFTSSQRVIKRSQTECTHGQIFSKSYQINSKSDCIYHFPIDLEQETDTVRLLFQINRKIVNTI